MCVCVYHNFFNHLFTNRHFRYFHVSAVVNSAPLNVGMLIFFELVILFPLDVFPKMELLGHVVVLLLLLLLLSHFSRV